MDMHITFFVAASKVSHQGHCGSVCEIGFGIAWGSKLAKLCPRSVHVDGSLTCNPGRLFFEACSLVCFFFTRLCAL